MKSPIDRLSADERAVLAHFYSSEEFSVLRKLIDMERLDLAKDHVNQVEIGIVRYLSGKSDGLKALVLTLRDNQKKNSKDES